MAIGYPAPVGGYPLHPPNTHVAVPDAVLGARSLGQTGVVPSSVTFSAAQRVTADHPAQSALAQLLDSCASAEFSSVPLTLANKKFHVSGAYSIVHLAELLPLVHHERSKSLWDLIHNVCHSNSKSAEFSTTKPKKKPIMSDGNQPAGPATIQFALQYLLYAQIPEIRLPGGGLAWIKSPRLGRVVNIEADQSLFKTFKASIFNHLRASTNKYPLDEIARRADHKGLLHW
ncbi:hypothetical protein PCANC_07397 [Puccinia coronata f. sp. avenae]|uniref:Uncharacterized protein n=1 Tax=Puccinia coronata f. sp. avenae TaxID=200324 RepID=A0A2N5T5B7_9BASI|nr:hypothetical protein PCANC_07397 [Puccinia coronata f. sp. avenae]